MASFLVLIPLCRPGINGGVGQNPFVPVPPVEQEEDTRKLMRVIDDISSGRGDPRLEFLRGRIDARREQRAISGHSAGAFVSGRLGDV